MSVYDHTYNTTIQVKDPAINSHTLNTLNAIESVQPD